MSVAIEREESSLGEVLSCYWKLVLALGVLGLLAGTVVSFVLPKRYRAEVIVATSESDLSATGAASQVAQLAGIAGIGLNVGGSGYRQEALATLRSREIAREFIEARNIATVIVPDDRPTERGNEAINKDITDQWLNRVTEVFQRRVLDVREDRRTGMVVVSIEWSDPKAAAEWANDFVRLTDDKLRTRRSLDADRNLKLLEDVIERTASVDLKQTMYRIYQLELEKKMQTQVRDSLFFRVIDPAVPPDVRKPASPDVKLLLMGGGLLGLSAGFGLAVILFAQRRKS